MVHLSYDEVKLLIYGYIRHFFFHLLVIIADIKHLNLLQLEMSGLDDVFFWVLTFFFFKPYNLHLSVDINKYTYKSKYQAYCY